MCLSRGSGEGRRTLSSKRMSSDEMGQFLADAYREAFGADRFHSLFDNASLADGQTIDFALAEWHAFGAFIFTYCLWVVYNDRNKVSPILNCFHPALLSSLCLNEVAEKRFLTIASDREREYVDHFQRVKDGADMGIFFSRVIARITGDFSSDCDSKGLPQTSDLAINAPLCGYVIDVMKHTKLAIQEFGPR